MANSSSSSTIPINVLTITIPIVIAVAEIAYIALGWKIYHEFGWKVYKFLGADRRIKKLYATYQFYECLVKFDLFFWAGFSVQFIMLVLRDTQVEYYITCAALPFSILLLVEGHLAARYEHRWMMATFMLGCVGAMVYFVYKVNSLLFFCVSDFVVFHQACASASAQNRRSVPSNMENPDGILYVMCLQKEPTVSDFVLAIISIVFLCATFAYSVIVLRNFGRGLKPACTYSSSGRPDDSFMFLLVERKALERNNHRRAASTHLNRMSIE